MFEYMDGIVNAVEEFGQAAVDIAVYMLICVAKLALIITAPVCLLPYKMWRKGAQGMKYRQWKKNYKKKHGVNPPLELDKRKQRRLARKMARQINKTLPTAAETLTAAINSWVQSIKPALATLCENVEAAFRNMAAGLREESEAVEND